MKIATRILFILTLCVLHCVLCTAQSHPYEVRRPCPSATSSASLTINRNGDLVVTPCSGRTVALDRTITAIGTTGNQTINKTAGTINVAASAATVTLTDSLITANSLIFTNVRTADTTCTFIKSVVAASGSAVITMNAACTAATSIGFLVTN